MRPLTFILSHCGRGKKREFSPEGRGERFWERGKDLGRGNGAWEEEEKVILGALDGEFGCEY